MKLNLTGKNFDRNIDKRVAFVLGFSLPFPGAGWRRIEYFARYLADRGFRVYVLGSITPSYILSMLRKRTETKNNQYGRKAYLILNVQPYIGLNHILARILNIVTGLILVLVLLILKPHIIVVSVPNIEQVLFSYIASRLVRAELIVDIRDPHEDYMIRYSKSLTQIFARFLKRLNFAVYRRARVVSTVTEGLVRYLARHGVKALLAPNGADTEIFKPYPGKRSDLRKALGLDNVNVIVFSGYLGNYYRIDFILNALASLLREDRHVADKLRLVIIGDIMKQYRETFIKKIKELGIDRQIVVLGVIEDSIKLAQLLSACDVGLISRVEDPFFDYAIPAKIYEYIACGLPVFVLVKRGSDLWNMVERYKIGYVCQPHDIDCIKQVLKDIARGRRLEEFKARVLKLRGLVSREASAKRLCDIIQKLLIGEQR